MNEPPKWPGRTRCSKYPILADTLATPAVEEKENVVKSVNNLPVAASGVANIIK